MNMPLKVLSKVCVVPEKDKRRGYRGPSKEHTTSFNDKELTMIAAYAEQEDLSFDDAVDRLASEALEKRVRNRTGKRPSENVTRFRK
jgi:hypothetical protein